jgi:hypothetical protein
MSKRLLDYNPLTGEKTWFQYDQNDVMTITHEQDVQKILDYAHLKATNADYSKKGMKGDWWHYAKVPNIVILEMKQKHGVDFFSEEDAPKVFHLMNTEYKAFKTTDKVHNVRRYRRP